MELKIAIVGSRELGSVDFYGAMDRMVEKMVIKPTEVISGGAKGYDTMAARWAKERGIKLNEMRPEYAKYGRAATFIRNRNIVDSADIVVAFWDYKSKGTKYTIDYANNNNKTLIIIPTYGNEIH